MPTTKAQDQGDSSDVEDTHPMICSMTGYGEAQHTENDITYTLELRTVNSRYLKVTTKLPDELTLFEPEIEKLLRSRLTRGAVSCTLRLRDTRAEAAQEVNQAALTRYLRQLTAIQTDNQTQIDLATLLLLPGVCQPPPMNETRRSQQWQVLEQLTHQAADKLIEMRRLEGRGIAEDLHRQCAAIRDRLKAVAERGPAVLNEYQQRLLQRTNELLSDAKLQLQLDDVRREVALYAERCDINEEISRLQSHLDQFEKACDSKHPVGRKLDFLTQELLREVNTIGSKANDADIASHVIEMKTAVDRLKEQIQNVE